MALLTVLMSVYNENENILINAIESILNQTFVDFGFLIIIDNPDNYKNIRIIEEYAKKDKRIKYIINPINQGLPNALNIGIDKIDSKYIARMDADDISMPDRLTMQMNYLENNVEVDLIGTNVVYMDVKGNDLFIRKSYPIGYKRIRRIMAFENVFFHPTLMGKTELFKNLKYRDLQYAQDYDFICRAFEKGYYIDNMPEILLRYRKQDKINMEKYILQNITSYCIQKHYRKNNLNLSDIKNELEQKVACIDKKKFAKMLEKYDLALLYHRKNEKMKFIFELIKCFCISKYGRNKVLRLCAFTIFK